MRKPRVGIVGAGIGGLSAALRLAAEGWQVSIFEKQAGPGGKAYTEQIGEYRFDTGPSLLTLVSVFEELFEATGAELSDYVRVDRLDTLCHYFYPDGTRLRSYADLDRFAEELQEKAGEPKEHLYSYFDYSKRIYDITADLFLRRSLHDGATYRTKKFFSSLLRLGRIDALRTMDQAHRSFFDSPKVRQLFNRYATYNGSSPFQTPGTLNIIPYVEYGLGGYAVPDGIYAIPTALDRRAAELGVERHYGTVVRRIVTEGQPGKNARVLGLETEEGIHAFDMVISDADVKPTYRRLLKDPEAPLLQRYESLEPSSSGMVFYWGIRRSFPELGLHNIFFSQDYEKEFHQIFQEGRPPEDPTIYVNITSKVTPGDAPAGGENWFVLINVPPDTGQDWPREATEMRARLIERLSRELGVNLEELIEVEGTLLPPDIERKTDSHAGSLYGISSNTKLAAFLRHPNRSPRYEGLYHCGGSAHPGGGMPLVLLSGTITAELMARDAKKTFASKS